MAKARVTIQTKTPVLSITKCPIHILHANIGRWSPYPARIPLAQFPYKFCTASVRIYPSLPPKVRTRNGTMLVDNANTYAVSRSHLRCPQNHTENLNGRMGDSGKVSQNRKVGSLCTQGVSLCDTHTSAQWILKPHCVFTFKTLSCMHGPTCYLCLW